MSDIDSYNYSEYKMQRHQAVSGPATVILELERFISNTLYIHDGKAVERIKLSRFALRALSEVLHSWEKEDKTPIKKSELDE